MGRLKLGLVVTVSMWLLLVPAGSVPAGERATRAQGSSWGRLRVEVVGVGTAAVLVDPEGRTATLDDSVSMSRIPGCGVTLNMPPPNSASGGVYVGGGRFDVAAPLPGRWTVTVLMEHGQPGLQRSQVKMPTVGVCVALFHGDAKVCERRDGVRLVRDRERARWKVRVAAAGSGPDSSAVRLVRDTRKQREGSRVL
jgi:hypothetical protein